MILLKRPYEELTKKVKAIVNSGLAKETDHNANITEIVNKIASITGLANTNALIAAENKIPNVSDLFKNTDHDTKIKDIEDKYFITSD